MLSQLSDIEPEIAAFGREIFAQLGREQPSAVRKNFWISKMMNLSMRMPKFKTDLFRLVDVLPSLRTPDAIACHITEYLKDRFAEIHPVLGWALRLPSGSARAKLAAWLTKRSVKEMASLFIAGSNPSEALPALKELRHRRLAFTVDLLGEFCVSEVEAEIYLNRYLEALDVFSKAIPSWDGATPIISGHLGESSPICISVKLTALYSQCSPLNFNKSVDVLSERLTRIVERALQCGALVYVDAEDTANNPIIYATFMRVFSDPKYKTFPVPGIVLQAYCKESPQLLEQLIKFARERGAPIAIRLVKGAYWDYETVVSAQQGLSSPLFSFKQSSDQNFEKLTRVLLDNTNYVLPAIASHNVRSLSHACVYAKNIGLKPSDFELQTLFGMADPISNTFAKRGHLVRLYVPLGDLYVGMGYLVRRLLENTSNESFLRHTFFDKKEISKLLAAPSFHVSDMPGIE